VVAQNQRFWVSMLSSAIIRSFPWLLGFKHRHDQGPHTLPQGKLAGRLFSLFSMWVVRQAKFTSEEHKETAAAVIKWIGSRHGLN
jgi:hypothetical protein